MLSSQLVTRFPCLLGSPPIVPAKTDYTLETNLLAFLASQPEIVVPGGYWPQFINRRAPPGSWPAVVYEISDLDPDNTPVAGPSGYSTATVQLDCYSNLYKDVTQLAKQIRDTLKRFRCGWLGNIAVWGLWLEDQDDDCEQPQDGSGTWWYRRGLTYHVQFIEPVPKK